MSHQYAWAEHKCCNWQRTYTPWPSNHKHLLSKDVLTPPFVDNIILGAVKKGLGVLILNWTPIIKCITSYYSKYKIESPSTQRTCCVRILSLLLYILYYILPRRVQNRNPDSHVHFLGLRPKMTPPPTPRPDPPTWIKSVSICSEINQLSACTVLMPGNAIPDEPQGKNCFAHALALATCLVHKSSQNLCQSTFLLQSCNLCICNA